MSAQIWWQVARTVVSSNRMHILKCRLPPRLRSHPSNALQSQTYTFTRCPSLSTPIRMPGAFCKARSGINAAVTVQYVSSHQAPLCWCTDDQTPLLPRGQRATFLVSPRHTKAPLLSICFLSPRIYYSRKFVSDRSPEHQCRDSAGLRSTQSHIRRSKIRTTSS